MESPGLNRLRPCGPFRKAPDFQRRVSLTRKLATAFFLSALLGQIPLTAEDLAGLQPLSPTWLGKSQQTALAYENALELVAERTHAHPALSTTQSTVDWAAIAPATTVLAPAVRLISLPGKAALLHISLEDHVLEARDEAGNLIAHFPVSIARDVAKRPAGELHVTVVIPNPDYTFDPEVFPESEEPGTGTQTGPSARAQQPGRHRVDRSRPSRLRYPWHPTPEQVGRTESHGCFRLANWDAQTLLDLAWVGLPVIVEP